MRVTGILLVSAIMLGGGVAAADGRGNKGGQKASVSSVHVSVVFSPHDVSVVRAHYAPRYRSLPPGLQKKLARGGKLPPGWEKKMEPFPVTLERTMIVLPGGHRRGVMDGHAVIYHPVTHAILDIVSLF